MNSVGAGYLSTSVIRRWRTHVFAMSLWLVEVATRGMRHWLILFCKWQMKCLQHWKTFPPLSWLPWSSFLGSWPLLTLILVVASGGKSPVNRDYVWTVLCYLLRVSFTFIRRSKVTYTSHNTHILAHIAHTCTHTTHIHITPHTHIHIPHTHTPYTHIPCTYHTHTYILHTYNTYATQGDGKRN